MEYNIRIRNQILLSPFAKQQNMWHNKKSDSTDIYERLKLKNEEKFSQKEKNKSHEIWLTFMRWDEMRWGYTSRNKRRRILMKKCHWNIQKRKSQCHEINNICQKSTNWPNNENISKKCQYSSRITFERGSERIEMIDGNHRCFYGWITWWSSKFCFCSNIRRIGSDTNGTTRIDAVWKWFSMIKREIHRGVTMKSMNKSRTIMKYSNNFFSSCIVCSFWVSSRSWRNQGDL